MSIESGLDPSLELAAGPLLLRPWRTEDAESLRDAVQSSLTTVGRWLPWCHAGYGIAEARAWIEHCRQGWADAEHFAYAIFDGAGGELLGAAGLNQRNRLHHSTNLGYWVRQSRLGEGIAANAAMQVARFGFEDWT